MFTYLNPRIREKLTQQGLLIRIDLKGNLVEDNVQPDQEAHTLKLLGPVPLPLSLKGTQCVAQWYAAVRALELGKVEQLANTLLARGEKNHFATLASSMAVNSVLVIGNPAQSEHPLVRVHSNCLTGDVFGSQRCECGPQLAGGVHRLHSDTAGGLIVYMAGHEGRGIGLWAKAATYLLQDAGENTYQANESLGLPVDSRDFTDAGALIWHFIGNRPFRLLTNNPKKVDDLKACGLTDFTVEKHICGVTDTNKQYLFAKKEWGHTIGEKDLEK